MFRLYLLLAITVLLSICYFITLELFNQIIYSYIFLKDVCIIKQKNVIFNDIYFLVNYFMKRRQWFKCILMLQFYEYYKNYNSNRFLGICFHNLSYQYIARYYYINSLKYESSLEVLENLALICIDLKDDIMFNELCCKISEIDPENKILMKLS
uniref:hypothetical protein n=1 Tax=Campylaephora boydenii TaxID=202204 RepID=UPI002551E47B|nr:hypothetical protein QQR83_pgp003 [Campylaephora boydenii]WGT74145.1 hypothetical protein [Campylaephora boydenii]